MRLLALHARARSALSVSAGLLAVGLACRALAPSAEGLLLAILGPLAAVSLLGFTLGGADPALERTTPWPWRRWRAAELGAGGIAALLALIGLGGEDSPAMLRNLAGLGGLAALGAVVAGARLAWLAPTACAFAAAAIGAGAHDWLLPLTWPVQPGDRPSALCAAALLGLAGAVAHTRRGARAEPPSVV